MNISRVKPDLVETSRLDPDYYNPIYLEDVVKLEKFGSIELSTAGKFFTGPFGSKLPSNLYLDEGIPLFRVGNVGKMEVLKKNLAYLDKRVHEELKSSEVRTGDILIVKASVGEKICKLPDWIPKANITQHIIGLRSNGRFDMDYVCSFLFSSYGTKQLVRRSLGSIIQYLGVGDARTVLIPELKNDTQKYIGNKIRQAETLRAWGKMLEAEINRSSSSHEIDSATKLNGKSVNRVKVQELTDRLDPKYYSFRACCVLNAVQEASKTLNIIVKTYSNGFEERDFVEEGIPYITVSEVSSGRLKIESAPKISKFISIPAKANINENCVLVVRTGSIGTAVKVDERDKDAVISSHLIKLEFKNERLAAAVAIFLNSSAGKVLLHKISYGAVQPQIGQDELIKLPIPEFILANASTILVLLKQYESSIRTSGRLVNAAKQLVEALIENKLTEQELINAQQALERGDTTLDRQILSRLTTKGIDHEDSPPLFTDLDQLYELLEKAEGPLEVTP